MPGCARVELGAPDQPHRNTWVNRLNLAIHRAGRPVILVAHGLGCHAVAWWNEYERPSAEGPVQGALLATGFVLVARWIGGPEGRRAGLLSPLAFVAVGTFSGLQFGNAQIAMIALSVIAMMAFEERRPALGGAMLAFAVVSKLSPGLLLLVLLQLLFYLYYLLPLLLHH